jgi:hypothetical protein
MQKVIDIGDRGCSHTGCAMQDTALHYLPNLSDFDHQLVLDIFKITATGRIPLLDSRHPFQDHHV